MWRERQRDESVRREHTGHMNAITRVTRVTDRIPHRLCTPLCTHDFPGRCIVSRLPFFWIR